MKKYICLSFRGPACFTPFVGGVSTQLTTVVQKFHFPWVYCQKKEQDEIQYPNLRNDIATVKINSSEWKAYYLGACNRALWPLMHQIFVKPVYIESWWSKFEDINKKLAEKAVKLRNSYKNIDGFFVNDYQLLLVGKYLRKFFNKEKEYIFFLHIPWPKLERIFTSPWRERIIESLLEYDKVVFQTTEFCSSFLHILHGINHIKITQTNSDKYVVERAKRKLIIYSAPIGIDFTLFEDRMNISNQKKTATQLGFPKKLIIFLGVDRLDYIKGLARKIKWFGEFLLNNPKYRKKISLVQIINPSARIEIKEYQSLELIIDKTAQRVNLRLATKNWSPVTLIKRNLSFQELIAAYRTASVCLIHSLHDGMNLIAKEFIATNYNRPVSLVLSEKCGAAHQMTDEALVFNPYRKGQFFSAIKKSLEMKRNEKMQRVFDMYNNIRKEDVYWWIKKVLC